MDNSFALAVDPSPRASLLLGHVPTGMLPRRASPAWRRDRDHRSICPFAGPWSQKANGYVKVVALAALPNAAFLTAASTQSPSAASGASATEMSATLPSAPTVI